MLLYLLSLWIFKNFSFLFYPHSFLHFIFFSLFVLFFCLSFSYALFLCFTFSHTLPSIILSNIQKLFELVSTSLHKNTIPISFQIINSFLLQNSFFFFFYPHCLNTEQPWENFSFSILFSSPLSSLSNSFFLVCISAWLSGSGKQFYALNYIKFHQEWAMVYRLPD